MLLVVVLIVGLLAWNVYRSLRPIRQLTLSVRALAMGEPLPPLSVQGKDEIAILTSAFSAMAQALKEQQRDKEQLERTERLALIGQFFAEVTHEVRNPLNSLSLHTDLLADEPLAPEQLRLVHSIQEQILRLHRITSHYLNLARPHAPELQFASPLSITQSLIDFENWENLKVFVEGTDQSFLFDFQKK